MVHGLSLGMKITAADDNDYKNTEVIFTPFLCAKSYRAVGEPHPLVQCHVFYEMHSLKLPLMMNIRMLKHVAALTPTRDTFHFCVLPYRYSPVNP